MTEGISPDAPTTTSPDDGPDGGAASVAEIYVALAWELDTAWSNESIQRVLAAVTPPYVAPTLAQAETAPAEPPLAADVVDVPNDSATPVDPEAMDAQRS
jgi:hypothetical protein